MPRPPIGRGFTRSCRVATPPPRGARFITMCLRLIAWTFCVLALSACKEVPQACRVIDDELSHPLSFATYEDAGQSYDEWRADLTAAVLNAIGLPNELPEQKEPQLVGESRIDDIELLDYNIESWVDGVLIPYIVLIPERAKQQEARHVVILLHGHGETAKAPFESGSPMRNIGGRLLDEGYVVVSVELRSFGAFTVDGKVHDPYIAGLRDGEFIGQVVQDNIQVGEAVVNLFQDNPGSTISIFGHSFGGYIALHVGALVDGISYSMSSGHFLPYACVNTEFAHHGQDILGMEGIAEIYDVTGMIAPLGNVDVFFGGRDRLFTPSSREAFKRLEAIYEKLGGPGKATLHVNPDIGHRVDPDAVIASLPKLP